MDPRSRRAVEGLESPDFVVALQRQHHFVEPLEQSFAPTRVYLEAMRLAGRRSDRLFLKIDADASCALGNFDFRGKTIDNLLVNDDRQNSILEAVGEEDIAKTRADDRA